MHIETKKHFRQDVDGVIVDVEFNMRRECENKQATLWQNLQKSKLVLCYLTYLLAFIKQVCANLYDTM